MKKIVVLLLVIVLVLISGCTGNSNTNPNGDITHTSNSLKVTTFSAEPASAESNQDVYLEVGVKNIGDQNARDVKIRLYNPPFGDCTECWKIRNNHPSCSALGEDWACLGNIYPPDSYTGFEGEEGVAYWNLRAPAIASGTTVNYDFYARTYHQYASIGTTQLVLVNRNEASVTGAITPTITTSKGPIEFSVETKSPIVVSSGQETLRICFKAKNSGKGTVYAIGSPVDNILDDDLNLVHLSINFGGLDQVIDADVLLNQTFCTNFYPNEVSIRKTIPITLTGSYNYYEDQDITVKVIGY